MEFRLLGAVEAEVDSRPVGIGPARQQCVLAALLVDANRTVSASQLVDRVWGNRRLPARPRNALQTYVSLLRRALAPGRDVTIERRSTGYLLTVDPDAVDLHRFRGLLDLARSAGEDGRAAGFFEQALLLWRGEPFTALDSFWLTTVRTMLNEQHRAAELDVTDIRLRLGQHGAVLGTLADRVREHPLDERLAGQLMLALYRSGRPADALDQFRRTRRCLADELGSDPCPALRELHQQILIAAPAIATPSARRPRPHPVPRELPAHPRLFTGRAGELVELGISVNRPPGSGGTLPVAVIGGPPGIGKTAFALRWAHDNAGRFPDGQLYANLRGFGPTGEPVRPAAVLGRLLDALGVDPAGVPGDQDARAALYRSVTAERRLLVLLDDARDTAQVAPLLPGSATCAVLVTSRQRLAGLFTTHGAVPIELGPLTGAEAGRLLAGHLGRARCAAEPETVTELLAHCAGLPLAIGILAARAAVNPSFSLADLAAELRNPATRLDALDGGDQTTSLRAVLTGSYRTLDPQAAQVFGLLGLAPGADIGLPAVACLTGLPIPTAQRVLRELENGRLVHQHAPGRYRLPELIRLYAADQAHDTHPAAAVTGALRRLASHYLHGAAAASRLLDPHAIPSPAGEEHAHRADGCPMASEREALAWFAAEQANLASALRLATEYGPDVHGADRSAPLWSGPAPLLAGLSRELKDLQRTANV